MTHDGQLNDDDVTTLITDILGTQYGDADLDGDVDLDDLTILGTFYGQSEAGWAQGDFDGSGLVDLDDLTILGTFYGHAADTETASFASDLASIGMVVPEPTTPLILVLLSGLAAQRRRSA